jgi:hypothetical protein
MNEWRGARIPTLAQAVVTTRGFAPQVAGLNFH